MALQHGPGDGHRNVPEDFQPPTHRGWHCNSARRGVSGGGRSCFQPSTHRGWHCNLGVSHFSRPLDITFQPPTHRGWHCNLVAKVEVVVILALSAPYSSGMALQQATRPAILGCGATFSPLLIGDGIAAHRGQITAALLRQLSAPYSSGMTLQPNQEIPQ